jgi:glycosyltransferase involved in cell wall biosynthesis
VTIDPRRGFALPSGSVDRLSVDAPLEALGDAEAGAFFRSCHRVLAPDGRAEIAVASQVDAARLERTAVLAGFLDRRMRTSGEHGVLEIGRALDLERLPLVSIVIPSYKPDFFGDALASACDQTYPRIEIAISDNCPTEAIAEIAARFEGRAPIRYERHHELRYRNTHHCFELAGGSYVKFLLDDDLLDPDCVRRMVLPFEAFGDQVTLVTSRRRRIDEHGVPLPDDPATAPLSPADVRLPGIELGDRLLVSTTNSVGEFTTAMFRRADLAGERPFFFSWRGREYPGAGDLACWLNLLSRGDAIYLADPLSSFRIHSGQNTARGNEDARLSSILEWVDLVSDGRDAGFLADDADYARALRHVRRLVRARRDPASFSPAAIAEMDRALARIDLEIAAGRRWLERLFGRSAEKP